MTTLFPPNHGRLVVTQEQWDRLVEQEFWPVGRFEFRDEIIDHFVDGGYYWNTFCDTGNGALYKWCAAGGTIIVELVDETRDFP
ncbi:MAG: hypothetical protein KC900_13925 [Candidatus Omnitrophica bacterium]|nr:hypothetical protein [Candidatus Omnitrophota bacterium]